MYQVFTEGPIGSFLMLFVGKEKKPWEYTSGQTQNVASPEFRKQREEYLREQRAKGGAAGDAGWQSDAMRANRARPSATTRRGGMGYSPTSAQGSSGPWVGAPSGPVSRSEYRLGAPSAAWREKYQRWGTGIRSNTGWQGTLTKAPSPQSNAQSQRLHKTEGIQTRETRRKDWRDPFVVLKGHYNTPQLNPNLSYMFKRKNLQLGPVRRAVSRLL